ncbi:MAG: hydratase, partial [Clostridia bacterium]
MIDIKNEGTFLKNGEIVTGSCDCSEDTARRGTIAYSILEAHNTSGDMKNLRLRVDAMASHDITYVGIIQTARASGLKEFPLPYVLTNCHNSLCAVGGTINEDDHVFGLSAAHKYGGEFVPAHQAVIHQYMREKYAGCGKMILASDSHTRYGALGSISIGEGGPELVKQLLSKTYDLAYPRVVGVHLTGAPRPGVGPQDVALAIIGATFKTGLVKNAIMEFTGPGIAKLGMDFRNGIDVMTTETSCLSSIWMTDEIVSEYLTKHGRAGEYKRLAPSTCAYYDAMISVDLSTVEPMIALPFHPSNTYTIRELKANLHEILHDVDAEIAKQSGSTPQITLESKISGRDLMVDQGFIGGCSGGLYQNICRTAEILGDTAIGSEEFWLSVYPA